MELPTLAPPAVPVDMPRGLLDLSEHELVAWLRERDEKPLRTRQLRRQVLVAGAETFDAMTDLSKRLRRELAGAFVPLSSQVVRHLQANDGTHKLLLGMRDRRLVECVLIQEDNRRTACISTQVGCAMGCVFCASGLDGVERNLTAAEILEQLVRLRNLPKMVSRAALAPGVAKGDADNRRLTNIVVMGMGEPLANLDNLLEALDAAVAKDGLGIGARHITISTVGLPAKIKRLADLGKQYHLAVSLHAPNDALRTQIVPTNAKTGLEAILAAADYFFEKTGRQITYEYVLLAGINDDVTHGRQLALLLEGRRAHVNVIPFNDVDGLAYRQPSPQALAAFILQLKKQGISVKVRKRKGAQIDAACGQLRRSTASSSLHLSFPGRVEEVRRNSG